MLQRSLAMRVLFVAVLLSLVLTSTLGDGRGQDVHDDDELPSKAPEQPVSSVAALPMEEEAPAPGDWTSHNPTEQLADNAGERDQIRHEAVMQTMRELEQQREEQNRQREEQIRERDEEVRRVRTQMMGQVQLRRQMNAVPAPVDSSTPPAPTELTFDVEAMADLLLVLDTVAAVEADAMAGRDCNRPVQSVTDTDAGSEEMEEVVVVLGNNHNSHSMLIAMHRTIYHSDNSPCSHFATQQLPQPQAQVGLMMPDAQFGQMPSTTESTQPITHSLPLVERVILVVLLVSAVLLLSATVAVACVLRHKQRQQRVLIEPPTIQQLGLDVPMLSSSPSMSSSEVIQL